MRVLLLNANRKSDILAAPPIGLCYVATSTQAAGHLVQVLDLCFCRKIENELKEVISTFKPDVIGISIRNIDNTNLLYPVSYLSETTEIVTCVRSLTRAVIVLGGSGASLCPKAVLDFVKADFIVVSDGEESFVRLLAILEKGEHPGNISGVGSKTGDTIQVVPPELKSLTAGNSRVGDWIDLAPYEKMGSSYTVQTKRGCGYGCIYCTYGQLLEGNQIRLRSPIDVVDEIEDVLHRFRPKSLEFVDSVFNHPLDHCTSVLEEIVSRNLKCDCTATGVSPKKLDRGFLDLMWRAGFRSLVLSPESASETMIRSYGKGFFLDDLLTAAEALKKTRFAVMWCFLIGGPGENNDTLGETLNFTQKYLKSKKRPPYIIANYYLGIRLYPGTKLWQIALNEGFIKWDANPLEQLWYVSELLDLDLAIRQINDAAATCPEIYLGFDEKLLEASRLGAYFGELFRISKPYWKHIRMMNKLMLQFGIRFMFQPTDLASKIRNRLASQGFTGPMNRTASQ